jgi:hypothetical protein
MSDLKIGRIEQLTHTPGPWEVNTLNGRLPIVRRSNRPYGEASTYSSSIKAANGHVCVLDFGYGKAAEDEANAHLIAAAPELLAALRRFVELYDGVRDSIGPSVTATLTRAEAAIAKAEGR